jgi:hypothetical protein
LFKCCGQEWVLEYLAGDVIKDELKLGGRWGTPGACCIEECIALQLDATQQMYWVKQVADINELLDLPVHGGGQGGVE